jgi:hypothetical protein
MPWASAQLEDLTGVSSFSNAAVDIPLAVSLPTRQCTFDEGHRAQAGAGAYPGTSQVHLRLISGDRITTLELDTSLRVTPSSALMGDGETSSSGRHGMSGRHVEDCRGGGKRAAEICRSLVRRWGGVLDRVV